MPNRHLTRIGAMQCLFEYDFRPKADFKEIRNRAIKEKGAKKIDLLYLRKICNGVIKKSAELDKVILETAPEWPLEQIARIDKTILKMAIYEILYLKEIPPKVAIDEAVEIAKNFGGVNSGKFINGVLGTVYRHSQRYQEDTKNNINKED